MRITGGLGMRPAGEIHANTQLRRLAEKGLWRFYADCAGPSFYDGARQVVVVIGPSAEDLVKKMPGVDGFHCVKRSGSGANWPTL